MCKLENILDRCKKGDMRAAEQLYTMFAPKMFAVCLRFSKDRADAEDNLQDGFVRVFRSLEQYAGIGSFEGWMRRIFIHIALEKFRKNRPLQLIEELPEIADSTAVEDSGIEIPGEILSGFVAELPEKYRAVFGLYAGEEMSHKEIAAALGISEGTSKSNLSRAREILKKKVRDYLKHE